MTRFALALAFGLVALVAPLHAQSIYASPEASSDVSENAGAATIAMTYRVDGQAFGLGTLPNLLPGDRVGIVGSPAPLSWTTPFLLTYDGSRYWSGMVTFPASSAGQPHWWKVTVQRAGSTRLATEPYPEPTSDPINGNRNYPSTVQNFSVSTVYLGLVNDYLENAQPVSFGATFTDATSDDYISGFYQSPPNGRRIRAAGYQVTPGCGSVNSDQGDLWYRVETGDVASTITATVSNTDATPTSEASYIVEILSGTSTASLPSRGCGAGSGASGATATATVPAGHVVYVRTVGRTDLTIDSRPASPPPFTLYGREGWRALALPKAGLTLGGRDPGYLAPIHTSGYVGADSDQRNRQGTANVFLYDEASGAFEPPHRFDSVEPGEGFWVFVREDDEPYGVPGIQGGFPKTLDAAGGTPVTGAVPFAVSYTPGAVEPGINLVGNPYDEAIDWDTGWTRTDISGTVYVWDPAYNSGDYRTWDGTTGDLAGGVIPAGQGFHVEALSASAALTVTEAAKTGSPGAIRGKTASGARGLAFRLSGTVGGHDRESRAWVAFSQEATLGFDARDGRRLAGASGADALRLYTLAPGGDALAIAALPSDAEGEIALPLHAEALASGAPADARATLAWDAASLPAGWSATLVDRASGERYALGASGEIDLRLSPEAALTHSAADLAPTAKTGYLPSVPQARPLRAPAEKASGARFTVVLSAGDGATPAAIARLGAPAPNPARGLVRIPYTLASSGEAQVSVVDALGREVAVLASGAHAAGRHEATLDASSFAPGVYVVRLTTPEALVVRRLTVVR